MNAWQARHGLSAAAFQSTFNALRADGYRLVDVCGYTDGAAVRYAGIWVHQSGPAWEARHGLSANAYQSTFDSMRQAGFRLRRVSAFATSAGPRFAAIWDKAPSPPWEARHGLTPGEFQAEFKRLERLGFRLVDVCGYNDGGSRYAAIWEKAAGPDWQARHGLTDAQYQVTFKQLAKQGYVLKRVSGHSVGNAVRYAAIWVKRASIGWEGRHGLDDAAYQRAFDDLRYQGYQQLQVCGFATPSGPRFAGIWESQHYSHQALEKADALATRFMRRYQVPGLSVAITQQGRLVYARALGVARRSPKEPLTVHHRMRIASVSKPITAAAILLLVQQRKLSLARRVLGSGAVLGTTYGSVAYSARERAITVRQLLNHTSGFRNVPDDPMFQQLTRNHASLIGWVLDNRNPTKAPGTYYEYLNFGYCLLGRVIERISRRSYDQHVRKALLTPAGVTSMQLAGDTLSQRATNEVVYYGQSSENPYSMRVRRMDAHGGWIATAMDLLRFLRVVDGFRPPADLLSSGNVTRMTTGSTVNPAYALGWAVDGAGNWDHNGALPGTLSMLRRRSNQIGQAALINTRRPNTATSKAQDVMMNALYKVVDDITAELGALPSFDLYQ